MLLQACLNGALPAEAHSTLPLTPTQLAADAARCVVAGAGALHIHPRGSDGRESLAATDCAATLRAVRAACPGVPVGISTGAWIVSEVGERVAAIAAWIDLPNYASVNVAEAGALAVCAALLARGIGIEAGLASAADARLLCESGLAPRCLRVLIEPDAAIPADALTTAAAIIVILDAAAIGIPRLLHGVEGAAWPVLADAARRGYDTRIGFEDTLALPDGTRAPDNAALVTAARDLLAQFHTV